MKKTKINAIIVVEGVTDVAFLTSFIDAELVSTNGSDVPVSTIAYLKEQSKIKPIVVLTDPDSPGQKIRAKLDEHIVNLRHCFIDKKNAVRDGKVGVAEASKHAVLKALEHQLVFDACRQGSIRQIDLFNLGLVGTSKSHQKRMAIADRFHMGYANGKQFLKRANSLNLTYQELEDAMHEIR